MEGKAAFCALMSQNLKTHLKGMKKVWYCYFLGVALSWAAYPIIAIVLIQFASFYVLQGIFTVFTTLILSCLLYISMHEFGENDRKPYKWARYKGKGFVCGFAAFAVVVLAEMIMIAVANRYIVVSHPYFLISSLRAYATYIFYMPFFWFYILVGHYDPVYFAPGSEHAPVLGMEATPLPAVEYATCIYPIILITLVAGIGYLAGYSGKRIIKKAPKNKFLQKLLYRRPKEEADA